MTECSYSTGQALYVFNLVGSPYVGNGADLVGVNLYTSVGDEETQELAGPYSKGTLSWVKLHVVPLEGVKSLGKVDKVPLNAQRFDQHVVDVDIHVAIDLGIEHVIDESLISGASVFQPERHSGVAEDAKVDNEGCLLHIIGMHSGLVVSRVHIQEAQDLIAHDGVDKLIDVGK